MQHLSNTLFSTLLLIAFSITAHATTYYVDQNHPQSFDDNSHGSESLPWLTIQYAASKMKAGDTCFVAGGIYEESVAPAQSGSHGLYVTFVAKPGNKVIVRQFIILTKNYIRIIGFEITHSSKTFIHAIPLYGSNYCEILHNTIHHIYGQAVRNNTYYGNSNHNVIRGNTIYYTGCPVTGDTMDWTGDNAIALNGSYNLVEYNNVSHTLDFFDLCGEYNIIRNNYTHDFANNDFPGGPGDGAHVDFWQPFSIENNLTRRNIVENNFAKDIHEINSHYFQVRDELHLGISELLIRGNVGIRFGSYVAQFGAADYTRLYNNTFANFDYGSQPKAWSVLGYNVEPPHSTSDFSTNNFNFNNIYYDVCRPETREIIYKDSGSTVSASNNACELSGSDPSCSITSGINFINYANDDLHLQPSSNARNTGKEMTTVISASGSGISFTVNDAGFFTWGYGMVTGDSIKIGNGSTGRIVDIDYAINSITVNSSVSWTTGDPVVLSHQSTTPAIGAYEYRNNYSYDLFLEQPAIISPGIVQLTAVVLNPENVRFIEFFIDGIPFSRIGFPPYHSTWNVHDTQRTFDLTAKAYTMFADTLLIKSSTRQFSYASTNVTSPNFSANALRDFELRQNYPNPFNPSTTIEYQIQSASHVTLRVFDAIGKEVAILIDEVQQPGSKSVKFDTSNLAGGVYFYRLQAGPLTQTKKLILLR